MKLLYLIIICICLVSFSHVKGAAFDDLSDECCGQYLYLNNNRRTVVLIFSKLGTDNKWICRRLGSGELVNIDPYKVEILPVYTDSDDFDLVSFCAGYAIPPQEKLVENELKFNAFRQILRYHNSPRGDSLRSCLGSIDVVLMHLTEIVRGKQTIGMNEASKIRDILDNSDAIKQIQNFISNLDFQLAISCYCRLRINVLSILKGKALPHYFREDIERILNDVGLDIRRDYTNNHDNCQLRISQFQACCPHITGFWCQGSLFSELEIYQFGRSCFECFQQTLEYSEKLDFPHWGNAMLSVLQLLPKDELISKQAALFDECLKQYKEKYQVAN